MKKAPPTVVVHCPRCRKRTLRVWKHEHNRFVCSGPGPCKRYEASCDNPRCEYPMPKGSRAWSDKHPGEPFWDGPKGGWVSEEAKKIWTQKVEPLPAPFEGKFADE